MDAATSSFGRVVVDATLSGRLRADARLGERSAATLFAVSRTVGREALIRLDAQEIVHVSARRGWFVVEPSFAKADAASRSVLLGDPDVGLLEALGDRVRADTLRDLTTRTVPISAICRSAHEAAASCDGHEAIVDTRPAGDIDRVADLAVRHIGDLAAGLNDCEETDALSDPRFASQPRARSGG